MRMRTIRARIALLTGGLIALIFVGLGFFLYLSLSTQMQRALNETLQVSAAQFLSIVEYEDGGWRFDEGDSDVDDVADTVSRLVSPDGVMLDDRSQERVTVPPATLQGDGGLFTLRYNQASGLESTDEDDERLRLLSMPVVMQGETVAYLQVGRSLETIRLTLRRLLILLLIAGPVLVLLASALGYWLAGQTLAPLEAIRRRAASISAQDLSARIEMPLPDDEVGQMAHTFNQMLARLEESFHRQRRFTADASHELRTPLSVIRGEVDVTLGRPRDPAEYQRALRSIGGETEWMTRLVNDLLLLARSDATEFALERVDFDLADLLDVLVEQMQGQAASAGVTLQTDLTGSLPIHADPDRLLQVFANLMQNALIHAPGSRVTVRTHLEDNAVAVSVSDTGPGIAAAHLPHLFERFYRVNSARSQDRETPGGSGLGLSIVRQIVHAHGGTIAVESEVGRGTTFVVRLPQTDRGE